MSDITVLLDENIGRMQSLSQEGEQALNEVNQLEQLVTDLIESVAEKEQKVLSEFEALGGQFAELNQKLDTELQTGLQGLTEFRQKAEGLEGQLDQFVNHLHTQVGELKARAEEALTEVESQVGEVQPELEGLTQQVQEFESTVDGLEDELVQSVGELGTTVETASNEFGSRKTTLMDEFNSLSQLVGEKLQTLLQDFDYLAQESSAQLSQIDTALTTAANEAVTAIQQKFNEIGGEITTAAQRLTTAVASVGEAGTDDCDRMNEKFGEVIDQAEAGVLVLQEIMPVLEDVEEQLA